MTKTRKRNKVTTFEGLPLVDAAEDVSIVINKKDVSSARKKDPNNCAAALAGRREFHTDVRVYMTKMYVKDEEKKRWIRFMTPMSAQKEIVSFDRGANFEPGEYTFKAPTESSRLGYHGGGNRPKTGKGTKKARHTTANVRVSAKDKVESKSAEKK